MSKWPSQRPSSRPSSRPGARDSKPPSYELPSRSIHPSQPRNRAIIAGICATLFGALVVSAFVRACEGDGWGDIPHQAAPAPEREQP